MKSRQFIFLILLFPLISVADDTRPETEAVGKVIDDFHDAAAQGDKERYFSHLTDGSVYLGTGVLTRQSGQWKLEHYAMSFLIYNENWDEVIELTKRTKAIKDFGKIPEPTVD